MSLVDDVIEAHGGMRQWRAASAVRLHLAAGGLAFTTKGRRLALRDVTATVATEGQRVELSTPTSVRRFDADIPHPRGVLWSGADVAAFAAAALWTYVSLPFILPMLDVEQNDQRLIVRFPPELRTHSPTQTLHIDGDGLISRHDYTALAFGRWAQASQAVSRYVRSGGLAVATRRRVYPHAWPHRPLLVRIDVHSIEVVRRPPEPSARRREAPQSRA